MKKEIIKLFIEYSIVMLVGVAIGYVIGYSVAESNLTIFPSWIWSILK